MRISVRSSDVCSSDLTTLVDMLDMDAKLVAALRKMVDNGSMVQAAHDFRAGFANVMRTLPDFRAYSQGTLLTAHERLLAAGKLRSEERRVVQECVSTCRYR